jgi:hypothetical protein
MASRNNAARFALGIAAVATVALSACGDSTESGIEKMIEEQSGGNVDIDSDDGSFSIQTEDGSMTVDENGNFVVTDADGSVITGNADSESGEFSIESEDGSFSSGSTSELPDEWPSDVPEPDGLAITSAFVVADGENDGISVTGGIDGDGFLEDYGRSLEAAGFTLSSEYTAGDSSNLFYESENWEVAIVSFEADGTQATITLYRAG